MLLPGHHQRGHQRALVLFRLAVGPFLSYTIPNPGKVQPLEAYPSSRKQYTHAEEEEREAGNVGRGTTFFKAFSVSLAGVEPVS